MLLIPSRPSQLRPIHFVLTQTSRIQRLGDCTLLNFGLWDVFPSHRGRCILFGSSELGRADTLAFLRLIVKREFLLRDSMKTRPETSEEIVASEKMKPRLR